MDADASRDDLRDRPLGELVGGPLGILESALPTAAFVVLVTALGDDSLRTAVLVAVGVASVFAVARVVRGQTPMFALSGVAGVALAGFVVSRTGKAESFFLPGLLLNAGYALAWAISILVRWPLLGLLIGALRGKGTAWRRDPVLLRAFSRASWVWVGVFVLRLVVQVPLYAAGALVALGTARVAMGIPLVLLAGWLTYLLLRGTDALGPPRAAADPA